jgi:hypothetical protein
MITIEVCFILTLMNNDKWSDYSTTVSPDIEDIMHDINIYSSMMMELTLSSQLDITHSHFKDLIRCTTNPDSIDEDLRQFTSDDIR